MGWCMYELVYMLAAGNLVLIYAGFIIYNLLRRRFKVVRKILVQSLVSFLIVGGGVLLSEFMISLLDDQGCDNSGNMAIAAMLLATFVIIFFSAIIKNKQYVFNEKVDIYLSIISLILVSTIIAISIWEDDFIEILELIVMLPISIILDLFS